MLAISVRPFLIISLLLHLILLALLLLFGFTAKRTLIDRSRPLDLDEMPIILTTLTPNAGAIPGPPNATPPLQQPAQDEQPITTAEASESITAPSYGDVDVQQEQQPTTMPKPRQQHTSHQPTPQRQSILASTGAWVQQLRQQGNSLLEREGVTTFPSEKELKYLSYQKKVDEHLMNSWRIMSGRQQKHPMRLAQKCSSAVSFEIQQDGSLAFLELVETSGDTTFDKLVLASIKHAAPFPPIPKHLGLTRFRPIGGRYNVRW